MLLYYESSDEVPRRKIRRERSVLEHDEREMDSQKTSLVGRLFAQSNRASNFLNAFRRIAGNFCLLAAIGVLH